MRATTACLLTAGLAVTAASAQFTNWNVLSPADFFDAANWTAGVPTGSTDALINNGGTAIFLTDFLGFGTPLGSLSIGKNGGTGTLDFSGVVFGDFEIESSFDLGVTLSGSMPSTGLISGGGDAGAFDILAGTPSTIAPLRFGYTAADGDAVAIYDAFAGLRGRSDQATFSRAQLGVSDGAGDASVVLDLGPTDFSRLAPQVDVGVATAGGDASAIVRASTFEGNASGPGPLRIGVSHGDGNASADLVQNGSLDFFTDTSIGVATGTGDAHASLSIQRLVTGDTTIGVSTGLGVATADIQLRNGVSRVESLVLGDGAAITLALSGPNRGGGNSYSAIDAATTVTLAGELVLDLNFVPLTPLRFELINTAVPDAISGSFTAIGLPELPQGYSAITDVIVDAGVEKLVLDVTGSLVAPVFINSGSGDWFDAANWASPFAPGRPDPVLINNGGTATTSSVTAPHAMEAFEVLVGSGNGSGVLESDGVDLNARHRVGVGVFLDGETPGGAATGTATFVDANLSITDPASNSPAPFFQDQVAVGVATGDGTAHGTLIIEGGNLTSTRKIEVGVVDPAGTGFNSSATGRLEFHGNGVGVSGIETTSASRSIEVGEADESERGITNANGTLVVHDATMNTDIDAGQVSILSGPAEAHAVASVTLDNVEFNSDSPGTGDAFSVGSTVEADIFSLATSDVVASLTDVTFANGRAYITIVDTEADDEDSTAIATADINMARVNAVVEDNMGSIEIAFADAEGDGTNTDTAASAAVTVNIVDSVLEGMDEIELGEADGEDLGIATVSLAGTVSGSSLASQTFELGRSVAQDGGVAVHTASLDVMNSSIAANQEAYIGRFERNSTAPGNTADIDLNMSGSTITAQTLEVGFRNDSGNPFDARLTLESSFAGAETLLLGPDGTIVFGIEGLDRVTFPTVGDARYAVADALNATLDGAIIADFGDFSPPSGTHTFDLITVGSGSVDGGPTLAVENLPLGFTVDSFSVTSGMPARVRLVISGTAPCIAADIAVPFGVLDLSDTDAFIAAFTSGDGAADIAAPFGVLDLSDIDAFIAAFFAGCP